MSPEPMGSLLGSQEPMRSAEPIESPQPIRSREQSKPPDPAEARTVAARGAYGVAATATRGAAEAHEVAKRHYVAGAHGAAGKRCGGRHAERWVPARAAFRSRHGHLKGLHGAHNARSRARHSRVSRSDFGDGAQLGVPSGAGRAWPKPRGAPPNSASSPNVGAGVAEVLVQIQATCAPFSDDSSLDAPASEFGFSD